jgi:hypothetical protein
MSWAIISLDHLDIEGIKDIFYLLKERLRMMTRKLGYLRNPILAFGAYVLWLFSQTSGWKNRPMTQLMIGQRAC